MKGAPKLDPDKLDQIAALPLGSHLKIDPWDDRVHSADSQARAAAQRTRQDAAGTDTDHSQAVALHSTELTFLANEAIEKG